MDQRTISIPPRELQLRESKEGIFGLGSKGIIDHNVPVIAFSIRGAGGEACAPKQRLRIKGRTRRSSGDHGIDQRSAGCTVAIADQRLSPHENRISRSDWRLSAHFRRRAT
jgi:hypothetical protein